MKSWMPNRLSRLGIAGALFLAAYLLPARQASACLDDLNCYQNCHIICSTYDPYDYMRCMDYCTPACLGC